MIVLNINGIDIDFGIIKHKIQTMPNCIFEPDKSSMLKLDIDGSDLDAINGAQALIRNGSALAIRIYYKPQDIWQIILHINEANLNYKYKLQYYTDSIFDTVSYDVQRELK